MSELQELLVHQLQDLLHAETQIVGALPKMVGAAHCRRLRALFEKHLVQTERHADRLKASLELLGASADAKPCKGMQGLLDEAQQTIKDGQDRDELTADLALIGAAQKVEHYEISAYGTTRCLAKHLGERRVAKLLSHTLGEEESSDFLLSDVAQPLVQQALSVQLGNGTKTPWGEPGEGSSTHPVLGGSKARSAAAGAGGESARKAKA
jgi:Mn-containing catalase